MASEMQNVRDDIAFLRALAEEGRTAPLLGGPISVAAGVIFGGAAFIDWAAVTLRLGQGGQAWIYPALWFGAMGLFWITLSVLVGRLRGKPGARSSGNRATRLAWAGAGSAMMVVFLSAGVMAYRLDDSKLLAVIMPSVFAFYGGAWMVAAGFSCKRWLWATALGCYAAALIVAWLFPSPNVLLADGAFLMLLTIPQGIAMMRQEPAEVI